MKRPLSKIRPIGPFAQRSGVRKLQINFRFNVAAQDDIGDLEDIVVDNAPDNWRIEEVLVGPDTRNEVISVTGDNQITFFQLERWKEQIIDELLAMDSITGLDEIVIIGEFR